MPCPPQIQGRPIPEIYRRRPVLSRAVARWRAGNYNATLDALVDESGNGLHARLGSAVGPDANDPLRLTFNGKSVYFPAQNDRLTSPDSPATRITTEIDLLVKIQPDSVTGSADRILWSKGYGSEWWFILTPAGYLYFAYKNSGSVLRALSSSSPITAGALSQPMWFRFTRTSSTGAFTFQSSPDKTNWTVLSSGTVYPGENIQGLTNSHEMGATASGGALVGKIFAAELRSTINGAAVASFDAERLLEPYASLVSSTGETWTLNRSVGGMKLCVVDQDLLLFGTNKFLFVPDNALLEMRPGLSVVVAIRRYGNDQSYGRFFHKNNGANGGYQHYTIQGQPNVYYEIYNSSFVQGNPVTFVPQDTGKKGLRGLFVNSSGQHFTLTTGGVLFGPGGGALMNYAPSTADFYIGANQGTSNFYDGEFFAGAVFAEALSQADINLLKMEMGVSP